jgi:hypothetical protein
MKSTALSHARGCEEQLSQGRRPSCPASSRHPGGAVDDYPRPSALDARIKPVHDETAMKGVRNEIA